MGSSYTSAVSQLYQLGHELAAAPARKFDLALIRVLLAAMGNPDRCFRSVLIAGTNGKGSTAATLAAILQAAGHRTALYTSPHLLRINERIRVNGEEISDQDFTCIYDHVEAVARELVGTGELPWHPSFFETLTAMAFRYFAESQVDIAVLEVGMGGRLDATNVVEPMLSVITDISLDHQKYLGNTIGEIAREKAGIIRPGGVVVMLPQHPEANRVLGETILQCGARAASAVAYVPPLVPGDQLYSGEGCEKKNGNEPGGAAKNKYPLEVMGQQITVESPLAGRHQLRNIALAIAAAEQLDALGIAISPRDIETGIRQTRWPGRFEVMPRDSVRGRPEIVLDVAHNPAGAWALRAALAERYRQGVPFEPGAPSATERPLVFVFGAMRDKAIGEITKILLPLAQRVVAVAAQNPRSATAGEIRDAAQCITTIQVEEASTVAAGVERAWALAGDKGVVVITGSIYIVGEALLALRR
jgi:dihydrofolate synthase/folylpolyglutamate synthase